MEALCILPLTTLCNIPHSNQHSSLLLSMSIKKGCDGVSLLGKRFIFSVSQLLSTSYFSSQPPSQYKAPWLLPPCITIHYIQEPYATCNMHLFPAWLFFFICFIPKKVAFESLKILQELSCQITQHHVQPALNFQQHCSQSFKYHSKQKSDLKFGLTFKT